MVVRSWIVPRLAELPDVPVQITQTDHAITLSGVRIVARSENNGPGRVFFEDPNNGRTHEIGLNGDNRWIFHQIVASGMPKMTRTIYQVVHDGQVLEISPCAVGQAHLVRASFEHRESAAGFVPPAWMEKAEEVNPALNVVKVA